MPVHGVAVKCAHQNINASAQRRHQRHSLRQHNLEKYLALSKDDPSVFFHTPDKTLVVLVKLKEKAPNYRFIDDKDYAKFYLSVIDDEDLLTYATHVSDPFEDSVIYNDYEDFIQRTYHITVGKLKK